MTKVSVSGRFETIHLFFGIKRTLVVLGLTAL